MRSMIVYKDPYAYVAHPTLARLANGDWLAAFNHTRRSVKIMHPPDDPLYRTLVIRSRNGGATWEKPWFAPDFSWSGTECPGLACLADGTVLLSESKYAWYPLGEARRRHAQGEFLMLNVERQIWSADFDETAWDHTVNPWARGLDGTYVHISEDGAQSFPRTVKIECSPFAIGYSRCGVVELSDGRLAYVLCESPAAVSRGALFVVFSEDRGQTWSAPSPIRLDTKQRFSEPDLVEIEPGRLLCVLRHSEEHRLYVTRSQDGGATWSEPQATEMDGLPGHVLRLADGRLLCAYGRRKAPFGIRATVSCDGGRTWPAKNEIVMRDDLPNGDLGYPTCLEYEPGRIFAIYYGRDTDGVTCIQGSCFAV